MEMYSTACKEALTAKTRERELQLWKMEEEWRFEEARLAEEAALTIAEHEKAKSKAAMEATESARRIAELESQKRVKAEMKALKEQAEKTKALDALAQTNFKYRKCTINSNNRSLIVHGVNHRHHYDHRCPVIEAQPSPRREASPLAVEDKP
ncbi:uncharacterized protein LOC120124031 [Hibiscus syriacus]|uniref:uncharacterized protein LOC120124031 n=1 Tax=Hibiscus syriacus TaxID=106335 RepID=UPI001923DD3D|nr:uncharacterized protein LOC120124031 [Hibiscus syriacus]